MKFKCGDVVIKTTGGNKMTIDSVIENGYRCIWFYESQFNEKIFKEEDIVTIPEWKRLLKREEREDKINQLLNIKVN